MTVSLAIAYRYEVLLYPQRLTLSGKAPPEFLSIVGSDPEWLSPSCYQPPEEVCGSPRVFGWYRFGFDPLTERIHCYYQILITVSILGEWPGKIDGPSFERAFWGLYELLSLREGWLRLVDLAYRALF